MALLLLMGFLSLKSGNSINVPGFSDMCHLERGDFNLAVMVDITTSNSQTGLCGEAKNPLWLFYAQHLADVAFTLEQVNNSPDILPNISLGYLAMDTCFSPAAALAQTNNLVMDSYQDSEEQLKAFNGTTQPCEQFNIATDNIIGIIGPSTTNQAVLIAQQAGLYQIPLVSPTASSDLLSDKTRFNFFSRLVAPNAMEVTAILDFIQQMNWTYVSLVYGEGDYGEGAAKTATRGARMRGMCLAVVEMFHNEATDEDVMMIARKLQGKQAARIVIVILYDKEMRRLLKAVEELDSPTFRPVWFASSSIGSKYRFGLNVNV